MTLQTTSTPTPDQVATRTGCKPVDFNRYEKQNAAEKIDGYYLPRTLEDEVGLQHRTFERAKAETLQNMQRAIAAVEAMGVDEFFAITKRKRGPTMDLEALHDPNVATLA